MPGPRLLGPADPLPARPRRVLVAGGSGADKTTLTDREHVVRWAWSSHPRTARAVLALHAARPDLPVVRLRSHRAADRWVRGPLADAAQRQV